jgi:hypothetical protein
MKEKKKNLLTTVSYNSLKKEINTKEYMFVLFLYRIYRETKKKIKNYNFILKN